MNRKTRRSKKLGQFPRLEWEQYFYDLAIFYAERRPNLVLDMLWKKVRKGGKK